MRSVEIPDLDIPIEEREREQRLYLEGERADRLFIIRSGRVLLTSEAARKPASKYGKAIYFADLIEAPFILGVETISRMDSYEQSAEPYPFCSIQQISVKAFDSLSKDSMSELLQSALVATVIQNQRLWKRWMALVGGGALASTAEVLWELAEEQTTDTDSISGVSQEVIGWMAGISRESVNHSLKELIGMEVIQLLRTGLLGQRRINGAIPIQVLDSFLLERVIREGERIN